MELPGVGDPRDAKTLSTGAEEIFGPVIRGSHWGSLDTPSGPGSERGGMERVVGPLGDLLRRHNVKSLLDAPCGDFNWMDMVDLDGIRYMGLDVVPEQVERAKENAQRVAQPNMFTFQKGDMIGGELPRADLALCRDGLVHFPFADIFATLHNLRKHGITYLLTTTFPDAPENRDITMGQWRPLNFQLAPFRFPAPDELIDDFAGVEVNGCGRKTLGLWNLQNLDLRKT